MPVEVLMMQLLGAASPIALVYAASGAVPDGEVAARAAVRSAIVIARAGVDITYDEIRTDAGGGVVVLGLHVVPPGAPQGCAITIDRMRVNIDGSAEAVTMFVEGTGERVSEPCLQGDDVPPPLAAMAAGGLTIDRFETEIAYHFADSRLQVEQSMASALLGAIDLSATLDRLHLALDDNGDPQGLGGRLVQAEARLGESPVLGMILPAMYGGPQNIGPALAAQLEAMLEGEAEGEAAQALLASVEAEGGRYATEGGAFVLTIAPPEPVSLLALADTSGPGEAIALTRPLAGAQPAARAAMLTPDAVRGALDGEADDPLAVARALLTGSGAPLNPAAAVEILEPLAEAGDAGAMLLLAGHLAGNGEAQFDAYALAHAAAGQGAQGARSLLDRIEADMALADVLAAQDAALPDAAPEPAAAARQALAAMEGDGTARDYRAALVWAHIAAAGGERSGLMVRERLERRFGKDDAYPALRDETADAALALWMAAE